MRRPILSYTIYFLLIFYLVMNTGIISDEYEVIQRMKGKNFFEATHPKNIYYFLCTPAQYLTHYIWYYFFRVDNSIAGSMVKIIYVFLSFYLISKFFQIFLDQQNSFLASFLFVFFPSHDSTVYGFMAQYLCLSFAFYLYAFYLSHKNKLFLSFLSALLASFVSYGSTPLALSLFSLFAFNKEFKKGLIMIIPNIIYMLYFIPLNIVMRLGAPRIIESFSPYMVFKQFLLQTLTFTDAMLGPSMGLKVYYSFFQLSPGSIIIGFLLAIIFYWSFKKNNYSNKYNLKLIVSFIILIISSFLVFAATGRYPQMTFNLGNRVTIFGSLLFSYLIILLPVSKKIKTLLFTLIFFAILGISDHWKNWNLQQQKVILNIKNNLRLKNYRENKTLYVSGNQYSKYGPISHIEFLSEGWVLSPIFDIAIGRLIPVSPLNKRYRFIDSYLVDTKYNWKDKINDYINVYDSQNNRLFKLGAEDINSYIASLQPDNRHWMQICKIKFINDLVVMLMPRLKYIF